MEDDLDERIRNRAYKLWEEEGRPKGKEKGHWELARELVAIEDSQKLTMKKVEETGPYGEPVEEASLEKNLGEFPTLTDQGEQESPAPAARAVPPSPPAMPPAPPKQADQPKPPAAAKKPLTARAKPAKPKGP